MTFENGPHQPGDRGQVPPPQGQPGQFPPPPPGKKPTGNKRHGWLYVLLGALFILLGVLGFVDDSRSALLNWLFIGLGLVNAVLGVRAVVASRRQIDPYATEQSRSAR